MSATSTRFGFSIEIALGYEDADARVRELLKAEGFGVLTEIDVRATLREKLDVDFPRYVILGACNPTLAHSALQVDPGVGLLLPCNVVVEERADGGSRVSFMDPVAILDLVGNPALEPGAADAAARLRRVAAALESATAPSTPAAIDRWKSDLAGWAIPQEIVDAAPEAPWAFSPRPFAARADRALTALTPTPSTRRAMEALPAGGGVLDIGCGAGAASLPLLPRASRLVAVDTGADMLDEVRARVPAGIDLIVLQGRWPDIAAEVPPVDVVVCNHVVYNIADLDEAVLRMTDTARCRVVLELTREHPRSAQNFLWPIFHGIERPTGPTAADAIDVIRACGLSPRFEEWTPPELHNASGDEADLVASVRRYLCLGADRDREIAEALESRLVRRDGLVGLAPSTVVTVWWDVPGKAL